MELINNWVVAAIVGQDKLRSNPGHTFQSGDHESANMIQVTAVSENLVKSIEAETPSE